MGFSRQEYWSGVPLPSPPCLLGAAQMACPGSWVQKVDAWFLWHLQEILRGWSINHSLSLLELSGRMEPPKDQSEVRWEHVLCCLLWFHSWGQIPLLLSLLNPLQFWECVILRHSVSTSIPCSPSSGASLGSRHESYLCTFYERRPLSLMSTIPSPHGFDLVRKCSSCELQTLPPWGCTHSPRFIDQHLKDPLEVKGFLPSESSWETRGQQTWDTPSFSHIPGVHKANCCLFFSMGISHLLREGRKVWCYWLKVQSGKLTVKNPHEWLLEEAKLRCEWSPSGPRLSDAV